jgi:hypothetical protein
MYPKYGPGRTMSGIAGTTKSARAAAGIDLTHNAFPDDLGCVIGSLDQADELVSNGPFESGVPACDLQVGITNAGFNHAHECFVGTIRSWNVRNGDAVLINSQCLHIIRDMVVNLLSGESLLYFLQFRIINLQINFRK